MSSTIVLPVSGMSCGGCVNSVQKALARVPGVVSVQVSLAENTATVEHDPATAPRPALVQAIEGAGFGVPAAP